MDDKMKALIEAVRGIDPDTAERLEAAVLKVEEARREADKESLSVILVDRGCKIVKSYTATVGEFTAAGLTDRVFLDGKLYQHDDAASRTASEVIMSSVFRERVTSDFNDVIGRIETSRPTDTETTEA